MPIAQMLTMTHPNVAGAALTTQDAFEQVHQAKGWVLVVPDAIINLPALMMWTGAWSASEPYKAGDVVSYNGDGYIAKTISTNITPTSSNTHWEQVTTGTGPAPATPDATTTLKGKILLAGDLAGTASAPTVPGLATRATTAALTTETNRATAAEALAAQKSANLSDLTSAATARTNLGLGTAATSATTAFELAGAVNSEASARAAADALLVPLTQKGAANGVASLGADGKVPSTQVPNYALGDTFTVATQAAMLALAANTGDMAIRTDFEPDKFFILTSNSPGTLADWKEISLPGTVGSVDGQTGAVVLSGTYVGTTGDQDIAGAKRPTSNWYFKSGRPWADPRSYVPTGTAFDIGDGATHPLSVGFASFALAQAYYPHAVALTDEFAWAAHQAAINTGKQVRVDDGTFVVNRTLTKISNDHVQGLRLFGAGAFATIYDVRVANGWFLDLDGYNGAGVGVDFKFQRGTHLQDFAVTAPTAPVNCGGIRMRSQQKPKLGGLKIEAMTSDGLRIVNLKGDKDGFSYARLEQVVSNQNTGWGINCLDPTETGSAINNVNLANCEVLSNLLGGIRLLGIEWRISEGSVSYNRASGGIIVPEFTLSQSSIITIEGTEVDSNETVNILLESVNGADVRLVTDLRGTPTAGMPVGSPPIGVRVGKASGALRDCQNVLIDGVKTRPTSPTTAVMVQLEASSVGTRVRRLYTFDESLTNRLVENGRFTAYEDIRGVASPKLSKVVAQTVSTTPVTITPRLLETGVNLATPGGERYRITLAAGAASVTIGDPIVPIGAPGTGSDRAELVLEFYNTSGGAITPSLHPRFRGTSPALATGFYRINVYEYDATSVRFNLVSSSGDIAIT